jgi:hypothetical protein
MCVVLARLKVFNHESTWEPLRLLLFQILVTLIFTYIVAQSVYFINVIASDGRPGLYFLTLVLAVVIDQIKSVFFLYALYVIIVRRFMHLNVNESEYLKSETLSM